MPHEKKRYGPPGPRRRRLFTDDQIAQALKAARGIQSIAARALEASSGIHIDRSALSRAISRSKRLQKVREDCLEEALDMGEDKLFLGVQNGDAQLIKFLLETQGKNRGYTRRTELVRAEPSAYGKEELQDARRRNLDLIESISKRLSSGNSSEGSAGSAGAGIPQNDQTADRGVSLGVAGMVGQAVAITPAGRVVQLPRTGREVLRQDQDGSGVDKRTG